MLLSAAEIWLVVLVQRFKARHEVARLDREDARS